MNYDKARELLATAFQTAWATTPPFSVVMENQPAPKPSAPTTWGRVSILFGQSEPPFIGNPSTRCPGVLTLQVFLPEEKGIADATKAADRMAAAFDRAQLRDVGTHTVVTCKTSGFIDAGPRKGYVQKNITVPFDVDVYL